MVRFCVDGRYRSATKNHYGDITSKGRKVLVGYCSVIDYNKKKSMTVSDNTIVAESLSDFFNNLSKRGPSVSKKMVKKTKERFKKTSKSLGYYSKHCNNGNFQES